MREGLLHLLHFTQQTFIFPTQVVLTISALALQRLLPQEENLLSGVVLFPLEVVVGEVNVLYDEPSGFHAL